MCHFTFLFIILSKINFLKFYHHFFCTIHIFLKLLFLHVLTFRITIHLILTHFVALVFLFFYQIYLIRFLFFVIDFFIRFIFLEMIRISILFGVLSLILCIFLFSWTALFSFFGLIKRKIFSYFFVSF